MTTRFSRYVSIRTSGAELSFNLAELNPCDRRQPGDMHYFALPFTGTELLMGIPSYARVYWETVKKILHSYLQTARGAVVWKLDGLSEYDIRRPLVQSGTNLLGIVKHLTCVELGYFGPVFGRPMGQTNLWFEDDVEYNDGLLVRANESRDDIVGSYRRACETSDATIDSLELEAAGSVPWWGDHPVTLHHVLVHVIAETSRHAGHPDLARELIDGSIGHAADDSNVPEHDNAWWRTYHDRVEDEARQAST